MTVAKYLHTVGHNVGGAGNDALCYPMRTNSLKQEKTAFQLNKENGTIKVKQKTSWSFNIRGLISSIADDSHQYIDIEDYISSISRLNINFLDAKEAQQNNRLTTVSFAARQLA